MVDEFEDRYEKLLKVRDQAVLVSIDKPINKDMLDLILATITKKADVIYDRSLAHFEMVKHDHNLGYIDDLSDPQIIAGPQSLTLYWWSDKGEEKGEAVIGIDFSPSKFEPIGLTIGD